MTWLFLVISNLSFFAIFWRWRGAIGWLETLYGFPVGLGFGVSLSSTFIGLTERVRHQVAVVTSGFYLFLNLGSLFGVGMSSLLVQSVAKRDFLAYFKDEKVLTCYAMKIPPPNTPKTMLTLSQIVDAIMSDLDYVFTLPSKEWPVVVDIYARSLVNVWRMAHPSCEISTRLTRNRVRLGLWLLGFAC